MPAFEFLVLTVPFEGTDDEFNHWYDEQHIPDVLKLPGVIAAKRFRISHPQSKVEGLPCWTYAAIYSLDCEDPQAVLDEIKLRGRTPAMPLSDTLDMSKVATYMLKEI